MVLVATEKQRISAVHSQLLSQLWQLRRMTGSFTGNMVDRRFCITNLKGGQIRPETVTRRLRELNSMFGLFECESPRSSKYQFTKTAREILDIIDNCEVRRPVR